MAITKSSFKMKYGGKPSDYEIAYTFNSRWFKSLEAVRKYAISMAKADKLNIQIRGYPQVRQYIDAALFTKSTPHMQSGDFKCVGYVSVNGDHYYWIVNKKDSRVLNANGEVVRKMTKADWNKAY